MSEILVFIMFILGGIGLTSILADSEFFRWPKEILASIIKKRALKYVKIEGEEEVEEDWWTKTLRKINYMVYCHQCMGFWVGLFLGPCLHPMTNMNGWWRILEAIVAGGVISYASQIGMAFYNYMNVDYGNGE